MSILYTHVAPDVDAAASVWAARKYMGATSFELRLVPAGWNGNELTDDDIAVDIVAGGRGIKGKEAGSAFKAIMETHAPKEDRDAIWWLIEYVTIQDSHGSVVRHLVPEATSKTVAILSGSSLNSVLQVLKREFSTHEEWIQAVGRIFSALLEEGQSRLRGEKEAERATWFGSVAVIKNSDEPSASSHLFGKGAIVVVYADGLNLGAVRRADQPNVRLNDPRIMAVIPEDERPKWFAHEDGFLLACGTRKSPATEASRVTPEELALAISATL